MIMKHALKMRLVPYDLDYQQQHPRPPVDPLINQLSNIDGQMQKILNSTLPLQEKLLKYQQLLFKYSRYMGQYKKTNEPEPNHSTPAPTLTTAAITAPEPITQIDSAAASGTQTSAASGTQTSETVADRGVTLPFTPKAESKSAAQGTRLFTTSQKSKSTSTPSVPIREKKKKKKASSPIPAEVEHWYEFDTPPSTPPVTVARYMRNRAVYVPK